MCHLLKFTLQAGNLYIQFCCINTPYSGNRTGSGNANIKIFGSVFETLLQRR